MGEVFQQVVGIGQRCRSRHQVNRIFGKYNGRRGVFDWQVTPIAALLEYLSRDFQGMFERADLVLRAGQVYNDRYGTEHAHEFPKDIQSDEIDRYYPEARLRHDRWCANARRAMANELSTLFVLSFPEQPDTLNEISAAIGRYKPSVRFRVLNGPDHDIDSNIDWKGDDAVWDRHLFPFELRPPFSTMVGYFADRVGKKVQQAFVPKQWR